MKIYRPLLLMLAFLSVGFLLDYVMDFVLSGASGIQVGPLPYYWISFLCQIVFGALFFLLFYFLVVKEWLTHKAAIAFVIVGGILLLYTPLWISFNYLFPGTMDAIYLKNPDFMMPAFWARSFFMFASVLVVATGVFGLLPKPKKHKK